MGLARGRARHRGMEENVFWKVILVLALVAANGFFVAAEFALVKIRASELRMLVKAGSRSAKMVQRILGRLDAYLSACQLGITLASLVLGWVGEPLVARMIQPLFESLGIPTDKVHYIAFPAALSIITFLHITAGKQAPKIYAIQRYMPTARVVGFPLFLFYNLSYPFIWILNSSSNLMLRAVGIQVDPGHEATLTEAELRQVVLDSAAGGHLTRRERLIIENVLDLEEKTARRYMVPRNQILFLDRTDTMEEKLRVAAESDYTRLPLCDDDLDNIIGIVHIKDVFKALTVGEELTALAPLARKPLFLPELITLDTLLREFQRARLPMALLIDEYGVVSGMITIERVLEELVGPILDESDKEPDYVAQVGPGRFEVDALCPIGLVIKQCGVVVPEESEADTIGGVVIDLLGHIPVPGEEVSIGNHDVTVLKAEPTRIQRVRIVKVRSEGEDERDEA